jgi:hypothetical protein
MAREPFYSLFALRWPEFECVKTWVGFEIICKLAEVLEIEPVQLLRMPPRRGKAARR